MKKKILFRICTMENGAAQIALLNILDSLDRTKFEPIVLIETYKGELIKEIPSYVQVFYITNNEVFNSNKWPWAYFLKMKMILIMYRFFPCLEYYKMNVFPDVEIAMEYSTLGALLRSPFIKTKKINWVHSDIYFYNKYKGEKMVSMMHHCDITVFGSHSIKTHFESHVEVEVLNGIYMENPLNIEDILH
ncbi:glycosyltransferase family protein [Chryseobacterium nematophagum]|nr:glycosyltransferase [Chryseobacterium nematophagum]